MAVIVRELAPDVLVGFRDMVEGDRTFIMSSWLRGFHKGGDWPRRLGTPRCGSNVGDKGCGCCRFTHRRFFDEHGPVIERLLARSKVVVACNPEKEWQVLGYVVIGNEVAASPLGPARQDVLHWVFVKKPFRWDPGTEEHPRIGRALIEHMGFMGVSGRKCSHWTKAAAKLALRWGLVYDPFLLEDIDARG